MAKFRKIWSQCVSIASPLSSGQTPLDTLTRFFSDLISQAANSRRHSLWYVLPSEPQTGLKLRRHSFLHSTVGSVTALKNRKIFVFLKNGPTPASFCIILIFSNTIFYRKNCRRQGDLNSDCWSGRQACWPLDHHYGTKYILFPPTAFDLKLKFHV